MKIGSLFSGYGGLDLGVSAALGGGEVAWHVEFDENPSRILEHNFPGIPNYGDISAVDWSTVEPVDVLTGGFPCQDVSLAGSRKGLKNGTRSGLWSEFARAIDELRPALVVIENVRGLLSADGEPWHDALHEADAAVQRLKTILTMVDRNIDENPARRKEGRSAHVPQWRRARVRVARQLKRALARFARERRLVRRAVDTVLRDLADLGFDAEWCGLRAADAGAPHGRFRVFILAWPADAAGPRPGEGEDAGAGLRDASTRARSGESQRGRGERARDVADADGDGLEGVGWIERLQRDADGRGAPAGRGGVANAGRVGLGSDLDNIPGRERDTLGGAAQDADIAAGGDARRRGRASAADASGIGRSQSAVTSQGSGASESEHEGAEALGACHPRRGAVAEARRAGRGSVADPGSERLAQHPGESPAEEARTHEGDELADSRGSRPALDWGPYAGAIRRWERVTGRVAPSPTRPDGREGQHRLSPEFVEWMMGLPFGWVTDPRMWVGMTESAARNAQLKALGNGVVWQQAALAVAVLMLRRSHVELAA